MLDEKLLQVLVCPVTGGQLQYDQEKQLLISEKAGLAYPIRDGMPVLIEEEAQSLDEIDPQETDP